MFPLDHCTPFIATKTGRRPEVTFGSKMSLKFILSVINFNTCSPIMNSVELANAISRANSRAKVITSLDAAYGSNGGTKNDSQPSKVDGRVNSVVSGPVSSKKVQLVVESLIGRQDGPSLLSSVRDFNSLSLSLENKALVLDNSKRQTDASKSVARIKR